MCRSPARFISIRGKGRMKKPIEDLEKLIQKINDHHELEKKYDKIPEQEKKS